MKKRAKINTNWASIWVWTRMPTGDNYVSCLLKRTLLCSYIVDCMYFCQKILFSYLKIEPRYQGRETFLSYSLPILSFLLFFPSRPRKQKQLVDPLQKKSPAFPSTHKEETFAPCMYSELLGNRENNKRRKTIGTITHYACKSPVSCLFGYFCDPSENGLKVLHAAWLTKSSSPFEKLNSHVPFEGKESLKALTSTVETQVVLSMYIERLVTLSY